MPLTFDLPLDQLATYQGSSPRPDDFDDYWNHALAEMHAIEPQVEIRKADFQTPFAECSHLYFTGVCGARIHAKLLRPTNPPADEQPAVVMFHGYTGDSGDWMDKLGYVARGFTVASMDCRGQGGSSDDLGSVSGNTHHGHIIRGLPDAIAGAPEKLLYRQIFLDTAQLTRIVKELPGVNSSRVGAVGGSQGGALAVACASLEPNIKLVAPIFPFLSDYQRVWEMDQAKNAYNELSEFFRRVDPLHEQQDAVFNALGYIDIQYLAPRITAETYWSIGLMDQVCPPSTQFAAYNKITAKKRMEIYPDFGHENLVGHSDRIFQFLGNL